MKFTIRIEENIKDKSYYVYGWAPYSELLEKYPLTAEYIAENISIRIPIPQMLHNPDTEEPLMWKMHWATPGSTVNSWKIAESIMENSKCSQTMTVQLLLNHFHFSLI